MAISFPVSDVGLESWVWRTVPGYNLVSGSAEEWVEEDSVLGRAQLEVSLTETSGLSFWWRICSASPVLSHPGRLDVSFS